mgnify:CR=1 FL=1
MLGSTDRTRCVEDERLKALLSQPSMVEILFSKGVAIYGAVIIAVAYTALAGVLQYKKEQLDPSKVAQLDRLPALLKSILPGFSFGSEMFLIIGMREEAPVLAFIILTFRMLHVVVGSGLNLCMFGPLESAERLDYFVRPTKVSTLRHKKDDSFCRENIPFVGLLVLLSVTDVTMLQFMPWKAPNRFYVESKGFPSMAMLKVCLVTKAVQTTAASRARSPSSVRSPASPMPPPPRKRKPSSSSASASASPTCCWAWCCCASRRSCSRPSRKTTQGAIAWHWRPSAARQGAGVTGVATWKRRP